MNSETNGTPSTLTSEDKISVLLVDDEDRFRLSLFKRLSLRGFNVQELNDPEETVRVVRQSRPDVVVLDRKMPKLQGEEVLREIKRVAPTTQVIMLTGHASMDSAAASGRLDAFAYLEKPCETEVLISSIKAAHQEKLYVMARHQIPRVESRSLRTWLWGTQNSRPGVMILGIIIFTVIALMPPPVKMLELLSAPKLEESSRDPILGYSNYSKMKPGETVAAHYSRTADRFVKQKKGDVTEKRALTPMETASAAKIMVGILCVAALFWATGALPIGITAFLVGVLMYLFGVFPPDKVAQSYAKDAVIFIMGVLAFSAGVAKTGLDRRIGLLLLGSSKSLPAFLFIFCPLLAVTASFLSEHALIAFIAPILMVVYTTTIRTAGIAQDRSLAVMLILSVCFAANQGGPGSPAAGGRNAVMIGILSDYNLAPSFGEWVTYGLPFVPVMALVIAAYFYIRFRHRIKVQKLDVARIVKREAEKIGAMTREEYITGVVLLGVVAMWITMSDFLGMGGPVLIGLVVLAVFRIIGWPEVNKIPWDVVALYGSACAIGAGLASTGAALWIASSFTSALPTFFSSGDGLAIASSLFTGILTNFMSDGATVSALGPIAVPMASISGTHPWKVGFATAFSSSFANCFIIGTPNNAIAYSLAKDLETGEQLVTLSDFLKHGFFVTLLAFAVLWGWAIFGYWRWIGF
ncbi:MAG: SLC13 family permease [Pseudomonadota bacterium]